ncbi:unnamed protein product [Aureobasidium mustum]|uniref:dihydropyrimidinase n=1 Tax=Aureobasidium mustum TaxID=2773714 RepID=A0A9N8JP20_9PEZI|nr:unnamed protein product [Aureobasidium mustum]
MLASQKNEITTMIHAENGDMIQWLTEKLETKGMVAPHYHALSRPPVVEMEATNRAIALAGLIKNPILFVHIGPPLAASNVRHAQTQGMPVYAETCPQYLNLTYDDLQKSHSPTCFENSKHVCSPSPPPGTSDHDELYMRSGLQNGTFTIFSSDHCPFRYDHPHGKPSGVLEDHVSMEGEQACEGEALQNLVSRKSGAFRFIPNGIPGVETRLPLLYTGGLATGRITPQKFVEISSTNPAKLYGLYPKKGALMPGPDADIVIWHPDKQFEPFSLTNTMLHHNVDCKFFFRLVAIRLTKSDTPYEGKKFVNWPRYTILRGKVIWAHGELKGKPYDGEYLRRGPSYFGTGLKSCRTDSRRTATWL